MDSFKDREKGFENKFAHDEELAFKVFARRNKLLGLWAAEMLGKSGADAEAYAMDVVREDFKEVGHEDVYRKLSADLAGRVDETTLRTKMNDLLSSAKSQMMDRS